MGEYDRFDEEVLRLSEGGCGIDCWSRVEFESIALVQWGCSLRGGPGTAGDVRAVQVGKTGRTYVSKDA
jgi:hypothetical protein